MSKTDYVSVDCGKYNTKIAWYDEEAHAVEKSKFRTKFSPGTFDDDMFDRGATYIVQVDDGEVYKVGYGAKQEPNMETSKKAEIHRICTLAAIARALCDGEHKDVKVVIGIPLQLANIPEERIAYKKYILGEPGITHTVRIKVAPDDIVHTIKYTLTEQRVYPEGIGTIFHHANKLVGPTAIIDIGNLNINNLYAEGFTIFAESCFTDELGGKILISGLAQELTSELQSRVDDNLVASTLSKEYKNRCLNPVNGNEAIRNRSREIIDGYLLEHVRSIRKKCDTRHYPLDFMNIVCVGGTARLLVKEIKTVFGDNAFIPEMPEYINVIGCLQKMCADKNIDIEAAAKEAVKEAKRKIGE